jgi:type II secretion system protein G
MNAHRQTAAFTLLEILLVVVIIGILTTIAIVKVSDHARKAKEAATMATIASILTAIETFELEQGKAPDSLAQLVTGEKHYLNQETVPTDAWGHELKFYWKGDLVKVHSAGHDGVFDTADDLINR